MEQRIQEHSYSLTPLQQGMIYHALANPGSGVDIEQCVLKVHEPLNPAYFNQALEVLSTRYTVFRTRFQWEGLAEPVQIVDNRTQLVPLLHDWKQYSPKERDNALASFLAEDRREGFDITKAPLMRINLCEISDTAYYFLWSFHHILLDGRSIFIVLKELYEIYDALKTDTEIDLAPTTPFSKYADWIAKQDFSEHKPYWQKRLAGFSTPVLLPETIANAPEKETHREQKIYLTETVTASLYQYAAQHNLTLNTLFQGAWALLLYRYSNQHDIVFDSIRACRHTPVEACDTIVGLLINTLPVLIEIDPEKELLPWLKEIREQQISQRAYEHTPLSAITQWSTGSSQAQLATTLLVFEKYHLHDELQALGGNWQHRSLEYHEQTNFPLTIAAHGGPRMLIRMEYQTGSYDAQFISNMLENMQTLLEQMPKHGHTPLGNIPYLSAKELATLRAWNATETTLPANSYVHTLFAAQAQSTPDKHAICQNSIMLSYREVDQKANQLAHAILAEKISGESIIAVVMERSPEMIISMLAILKAGCAFLPIDEKLPAERINFMLNDSQVPCVLTRKDLKSRIPEHYKIIACDDETVFGSFPVTPPHITLTPEKLAYVIYTSGSTGQPKGVMIEHKALLNLCSWYIAMYQLTPDDKSTQYAHIGFDASLFEIFPCLIQGATLHIIDETMKLDIEKLHAYFEEQEITITFLPTKICEEFMKYPNTSLRKLTTGGDSLSQYIEQGYEIYNNYGPTENCIVTTCHRVDDRYSRIPIGRPIANNKIFILDKAQQLVPIGAIGELCVSGAGLARGYLRREELTSQTFVPNPYMPGEKMYKTGDLARWLPDGTIDFLGRQDYQVKIRGYRIELGEIEALLASKDEIQHAVVLTHNVSAQLTRLVAYYVANGNAQPSADALRDFLKQHLPEYMLPEMFIPLQELPLTHNGKVDRKRLPKPEMPRPSSASNYLQPQTKEEKQIAAIWQAMLHLEDVGIHDNFFDIGGNSLLLVQVAGFLRQTFKTNLEIYRLFEYPTIHSLAAFLSSSLNTGENAPIDAIEERAQKKKAALARKKNKKMRIKKQDDHNGAT